MSKFKPGDKVICIDPTDDLKYGKLYEVEAYNALTDLINVKESKWTFVGYRFELKNEEPEFNFMSAAHPYAEPDGLPSGYEMTPTKNDLIVENMLEIEIECKNAMFNWPEFHSAHEGFAVLAEEVDELWEIVRQKPKDRTLAKMKTECIQIAAMALRFATEICDKTNT